MRRGAEGYNKDLLADVVALRIRRRVRMNWQRRAASARRSARVRRRAAEEIVLSQRGEAECAERRAELAVQEPLQDGRAIMLQVRYRK